MIECYACMKPAPFKEGYWTTYGWTIYTIAGEKYWFCPDCLNRVKAGEMPEFSGDWDENWWLEV